MWISWLLQRQRHQHAIQISLTSLVKRTMDRWLIIKAKTSHAFCLDLYVCAVTFWRWVHRFCHSQSGPSWPLPRLLSQQPLLPPRLQRTSLRLLQTRLPRSQKPGGGRSCNARGGTPYGWRQLQPEQPHQKRRVPKQRRAGGCAGQHVRETYDITTLYMTFEALFFLYLFSSPWKKDSSMNWFHLKVALANIFHIILCFGHGAFVIASVFWII